MRVETSRCFILHYDQSDSKCRVDYENKYILEKVKRLALFFNLLSSYRHYNVIIDQCTQLKSALTCTLFSLKKG